jgi:hypothetical protein
MNPYWITGIALFVLLAKRLPPRYVHCTCSGWLVTGDGLIATGLYVMITALLAG